jgi:hypothetical protein
MSGRLSVAPLAITILAALVDQHDDLSDVEQDVGAARVCRRFSPRGPVSPGADLRILFGQREPTLRDDGEHG